MLGEGAWQRLLGTVTTPLCQGGSPCPQRAWMAAQKTGRYGGGAAGRDQGPLLCSRGGPVGCDTWGGPLGRAGRALGLRRPSISMQSISCGELPASPVRGPRRGQHHLSSMLPEFIVSNSELTGGGRLLPASDLSVPNPQTVGVTVETWGRVD